MIRIAIATVCSVLVAGAASAADVRHDGLDLLVVDDVAMLQGAWNCVSGEEDGKIARKEKVARVQLTFKGDKLIIKGNFQDDRVESCSYKVDSSKSPRTLDFTPPSQKVPVLCIYEINGDDLKICFVRGSAKHPREMTSKKQTIITLKRGK